MAHYKTASRLSLIALIFQSCMAADDRALSTGGQMTGSSYALPLFVVDFKNDYDIITNELGIEISGVDFGGRDGMNQICRGLASHAGLSNAQSYQAFVSVSTFDFYGDTPSWWHDLPLANAYHEAVLPEESATRTLNDVRNPEKSWSIHWDQYLLYRSNGQRPPASGFNVAQRSFEALTGMNSLGQPLAPEDTCQDFTVNDVGTPYTAGGGPAYTARMFDRCISTPAGPDGEPWTVSWQYECDEGHILYDADPTLAYRACHRTFTRANIDGDGFVCIGAPFYQEIPCEPNEDAQSQLTTWQDMRSAIGTAKHSLQLLSPHVDPSELWSIAYELDDILMQHGDFIERIDTPFYQSLQSASLDLKAAAQSPDTYGHLGYQQFTGLQQLLWGLWGQARMIESRLSQQLGPCDPRI